MSSLLSSFFFQPKRLKPPKSLIRQTTMVVLCIEARKVKIVTKFLDLSQSDKDCFKQCRGTDVKKWQHISSSSSATSARLVSQLLGQIRFFASNIRKESSKQVNEHILHTQFSSWMKHCENGLVLLRFERVRVTSIPISASHQHFYVCLACSSRLGWGDVMSRGATKYVDMAFGS